MKRKLILTMIMILTLVMISANALAYSGHGKHNWKYWQTRTTTATLAATASTTRLTQSTTAPTTTASTTTKATTVAPTTSATTATTTAATTKVTTATTTAATTTSTPVSTTARYVAISGSDTNAGSATAPFRTIQRAINVAPANSTIYVRAGTYNEKLTINGKSGLAIKNYPGEMPILSGSGFSSGNLVTISGGSNIVFSGFEVCNFKGANIEGIFINNAAKNIEISACKIHDIATTQSTGNAHAILACGDSNTAVTGITIKGNEVYKCTTGWSESITMEANVDGFSITNNKVHDVTNIAIDATGFYDSGCTTASMNQARNGVIANNLIYNLNCAYASCAGIYVDGGRSITIENNTVHNSMFGIEIGCENPYDEVNTSVRATVSNIIVRYNTVYNNLEGGINIGGYNGTSTGQVVNSQIYNNTTYNNAVELTLCYADNIAIYKNIFNSASGGSLVYNEPVNKVTNLNMNNNVLYADSGTGEFELNNKTATSLATWRTISGQDLNSKFVNPLFVSKTTGNFNLQASSTAIGFGAK